MSKERSASKIVVHHVGGRGLDVSLNLPPGFRDDFRYVLYEADADSYREMT